MKKNLQSPFDPRQYMLSKDFEIYYYSDHNLSGVNLHTHDYYEFYFFVSGDISMQIGNQTFSIAPGDVMLIPPYLPHRPIIHSTEVPYQRFVFWLGTDYCNYLKGISEDYLYLMNEVKEHKNYIFHNDQITFNAIQSKVLRLIEEMQTQRFARDAQISLCVQDLLLYLNRRFYELNGQKAPEDQGTLCQQLMIYIEEHLDENLSLELLSRQFFVSKYHIAHIFKSQLGLSIHQYITKKRLTLCREAILGKMSITEACQTFGFGDYSCFYRAFKKEYGIAPKDLKKRP